MSLDNYLRSLALANGHGWAFLAAYGVTWLLCALVWFRSTPRNAAFATLFQGMVALPAALTLTVLTPGPPRPTWEELDSLSVTVATGQLLGLPVIVYLVISGRYPLVPLGMVTLMVVHFAPYTWLYDTILYMVMGAAVSLCAVIVMRQAERQDGPGEAVGAGRVCLSTGILMLSSAVVAAAL